MNQSIHTLLCERDLSMALVTIPRILQFMVPDQEFVILDDGSLTEGSMVKLKGLSPAVKVVTLNERNDFILKEIGDRPNCRKFREESPFAFKLIDIPLIASYTSPRFTLTDSDILYLRNCEKFFSRSVNTHLRTDAIKLSFRLRNGLLKHRWPIPFRFNSGYFSFDTADYDLDFVEYYLGLPDIRNASYLIEQGGWALLFGRARQAYCPTDDQFVCREKFDGPKEDTLAIHLIGGLKRKVKEWSDHEVAVSATVEPKFEMSRNVSLMDWAKKSIRRIF